MIDFLSHPDCTKCSLHESATNPGLNTRGFDLGLAKQHRALLIVGPNPIVSEDKRCKSWTGYIGQLL